LRRDDALRTLRERLQDAAALLKTDAATRSTLRSRLCRRL